MANGGAPMGPGEGNVYLGGGQWGPKGSFDPTNPGANIGPYSAQAANGGGGNWLMNAGSVGGGLISDFMEGSANPNFGLHMPNFSANNGTAQLTPLTRQIQKSGFASSPPGGGVWGTNPEGPTGAINGGAGSSNQPFDEKSFWSMLQSQLTGSNAGFDQTNAGLGLKQSLQQMSDEDKMATQKALYGGDLKKTDLTLMGAGRDRTYGQSLIDAAKTIYSGQTTVNQAQYKGEVNKIYSDAAASSGGFHQGSKDQQAVAAQNYWGSNVAAAGSEKELEARGTRYMQMADELAAKTGVDRQQLLINLNDQLRQLGLDTQISAADLFVAQGSNDAQKAGAATAIFDKLASLAQQGGFGGSRNVLAPASHHVAAAPAGHPNYAPVQHARFS